MQKTRFGAVLVALLMVAGMLACPDQAFAQWGGQHSSWVDGIATEQSDGRYLYEFAVINTSDWGAPSAGGDGETPLIVDWELPLFDANVITDVTCPDYWLYEIIANPMDDANHTGYYNNPTGPYGQYKWNWTEAGDPYSGAYPNASQFENPPYLLHWYTPTSTFNYPEPINPIYPGQSLTGFSFMSAYSEMNSPYEASWYWLESTYGDPPGPTHPIGPNSPNSPGGGPGVIPEPLSAGMVMLSCLAVGGYLKKRRQA